MILEVLPAIQLVGAVGPILVGEIDFGTGIPAAQGVAIAQQAGRAVVGGPAPVRAKDSAFTQDARP